jgi:predicted nucleic acid-binding protein
MAVLVDTSVWIDHLRKANTPLVDLLRDNQVLIHSAVIGELACGNLPNRKELIASLLLLPRATEASFEETLRLIESSQLSGEGLGWVDVQLLAAAALSNARLLTRDKRLARFV